MYKKTIMLNNFLLKITNEEQHTENGIYDIYENNVHLGKVKIIETEEKIEISDLSISTKETETKFINEIFRLLKNIKPISINFTNNSVKTFFKLQEEK